MEVQEGSPAARAGMRSGDLIIAIEGRPVTGIDDLLRVLDHRRVGKDTLIEVLRKGARQSFSLVPLERRGD